MGSEDWGVEVPGGWYHDQTHCYRDEKGNRVPSVTQVFDLLGLTDFSMISPAVLEWKRVYGSAVHRSVELLIEDDLDWESLDEAVIPALTGVEQKLKALQFKSAAREENRVYNLFQMRYGGTLDHRGTCIHQGVERHCIIDLKTAAKASPTWGWQVGAYSQGLEKQARPWLGIVLQVDKEGEVTPHYVDCRKALGEFQVWLSACILGLNTGLYKLGKNGTV
jgi:hypothetical protein